MFTEVAMKEIVKPIESALLKEAKNMVDDGINITDLDKSIVKDMPSRDEDIKKQDKEINAVENEEKALENDNQKGNYGEMKVDQDLREKGYVRISDDIVTSIDDSGHKGIDGVYYNPDGQPQYIIVDAKYNKAQLKETADGMQMSDKWINERLDKAVGKEMADKIRMEMLINPDNVGRYVAHVDINGNVTYDKLDSNANIIAKGVAIND